MLPDPAQALPAHQGEELAFFILPAAILLGTWIFSAWPVRGKPSKDSPETPPTEGAKPRDGG